MSIALAMSGAVDSNDLSAQVQVGTIAYTGGNEYMYVKMASTDTATANYLAYWSSMTAFTVTPDITDSLSGVNSVAGVFQTALTNSYYGWILRKGYVATLRTDGGDDITAGCSLISHASTDGVVDIGNNYGGTAAVYRTIGYAVAADSSTCVAAVVNCEY